MSSRIAAALLSDLDDAALDELALRLAPRLPQATPTVPRPYLTVEEAADLLRCRPQRIYNLVSAGRLRRVKDGSRLLIRAADLERHLDHDDA